MEFTRFKLCTVLSDSVKSGADHAVSATCPLVTSELGDLGYQMDSCGYVLVFK